MEPVRISVHHYMLKDTTVASEDWEGMDKGSDGTWVSGYHGYKPQGTPQEVKFILAFF